MVCSQVPQLFTKNTFLEVVEEQPCRQRVVTDSAIWCDSRFGSEDLPEDMASFSTTDTGIDAEASMDEDAIALQSVDFACFPSESLIVRNTFLELSCDGPSRRRVQTDSAVWCDFPLCEIEKPNTVSFDGGAHALGSVMDGTDSREDDSSECSTPCFLEHRNNASRQSPQCDGEPVHAVRVHNWMPFMMWQCNLTMAMPSHAPPQKGLRAAAASSQPEHDTKKVALVSERQHLLPAASQQGSSEAAGVLAGSVDARTTVMLRNLPNNYTAKQVLAMLDKEGFAGLFDFFYLPMDLKTQACKGYAFINLVHSCHVEAFWKVFNGYSDWLIPSRKLCRVTWSDDQGLVSFQQRYRDSALMHESVPDAYKPMMFRDGKKIAFTSPTRVLQAPRLRENAK